MFTRITTMPARVVDGVPLAARTVYEDLPQVAVKTALLRNGGETYEVDHVEPQQVDGKPFAGHDFVVRLDGQVGCPLVGLAPLPLRRVERGAYRPGPSLTLGDIPSADHGPMLMCQHAVGIVGGRPVVNEPTPWQAEIYSDARYTQQDLRADAALVAAHSADAEYLNARHAYEFRHRCGAVLITRNWLLTAQHCIANADGRIDPAYFIKYRRIRLGTQDLVQGGATYAVEQVVLHKDYNLRHYRNDIALVRIAPDRRTDTSLNPALVQPIRLLGMRADDPGELAASSVLTVYGWGTQSPRGEDDPDHLDDAGHLIHEARHLREVNLAYVPGPQCARTYPGAITASVVCAGYAPGGRDSCQGDSGGPMTLTLPGRPDDRVLAGLVSGGYGCALRDTPGIYTRVSAYLGWILGVVGDEGLVP